MLRQALLGPDGKLRPLWRALLFLTVGYWALPAVLDPLIARLGAALHLKGGFTAANIGLNEIELLLIAALLTGIFALYEGRRIDDYGLPIRQALSGRTFEGVAAGVIMAGIVGVAMYLAGAMRIDGFALGGGALVLSALAWLATNICIGIAEEAWYRGYLFQTLFKSLGFWPAALILAAIFAADHYFYKAGENIWDVITLVGFSVLICYSVLRTGTLWWAVGMHMGFDYTQLFLIGTPNGNLIPDGRLLNVRFEGPAWLTGGVLGTEASFLMYPVLLLAWLYLWRRFRAAPATPA